MRYELSEGHSVSRFRRSFPFAARANTNVGTKGTLAAIDSSVALDWAFP